MLSNTEINQMVEVIESTFPDTATIKRRSQTNDGFGGTTTSESTVVTVNCAFYINKAAANDTIVADGPQNISTFTILLPKGTDIIHKDSILIGSRVFEATQVQTRSYEMVTRVKGIEIL